ncbi:hypothetical protein [Parapedomonas caeni]
MKRWLLALWSIEVHIRAIIGLARYLDRRLPWAGHYVALVIDRLLLILYGVDVTSARVNVRKLSVSHPVGVLLGGNGIVSPGRVVVMAGVKFVGRSPTNPEYLARHKEGRVFVLGDNVVIGAGSILVGPLDVCDNVVIGAMSLVNRSITEPGVYVGIPAVKISDDVTEEWVAHL